jgi:hypothetical protein
MGFGISDIKSIFDRPKNDAGLPKANQQAPDKLIKDMDAIYKMESQNWYSAKPYGFKMNTREGGTFIFFLPISPSNIQISTPFATNMIPTLYGTVEEHSDVRYFDINIEGTTGFAPRYVDPGVGDKAGTVAATLRQSGRSTFEISQSLSLGGFFSKTLGIINQIKNKAVDLYEGSPKPKSGIAIDKSGYAAFHNLYRFLLQHKKDAAGTNGSISVRKKHPLTFFNYKDNNQYDVVVRNFTMRRSADNPMLYYYSIQLRGYNIRSIGDKVDEDLTKRLRDLGLNGVDSSSILGDIKSLSSGAKAIIGSALGGINILGR